MTVPRQRTFAFAFIAAVFVVAAPAFCLLWRHDHRDLTLRAGIRNHSLSSDLNPEGRLDALAVEILAAAARRPGLRLQWVERPEGPDRALRSKQVDLWPMTLDLPERRKQFYITEPWLAAMSRHQRSSARQLDPCAGRLWTGSGKPASPRGSAALALEQG
jgi:hypothetical protein